MPFTHCPACGSTKIRFEEGKALFCDDCGHIYYHNVATAAGALIEMDGGLVFVERAMEPKKGLLALPGGFVDPGERAEDAVRRECREEIGWEPREIRFLASFPNTYEYRNVLYNTCDLYFVVDARGRDPALFTPEPGEVSAMKIIDPDLVRPEELAFESTRKAVAEYLRLR